MTKPNQLTTQQPDPANFFAQISTAYVEVMSGARRAEQLARWFSDTAYYDLCQRVHREGISRALTGLKDRPKVIVRNSRIFLTDDSGFQGVVVMQISGVTRAVSIRAELLNSRYRVTDIVMINP
jgi:hypothetical protein